MSTDKKYLPVEDEFDALEYIHSKEQIKGVFSYSNNYDDEIFKKKYFKDRHGNLCEFIDSQLAFDVYEDLIERGMPSYMVVKKHKLPDGFLTSQHWYGYVQRRHKESIMQTAFTTKLPKKFARSRKVLMSLGMNSQLDILQDLICNIENQDQMKMLLSRLDAYKKVIDIHAVADKMVNKTGILGDLADAGEDGKVTGIKVNLQFGQVKDNSDVEDVEVIDVSEQTMITDGN